MSYLLLIAATAGAFAAFRFQQKRAATAGPANEPRTTSDNAFASVELKCGRNSCRAAQRLRNVSQLASEAPVLPLPGCDKGICNCSYQKTEDRRQSEGRRMIDLGIRPLVFDGNNQRAHSDDRRL